ncbi:MAG: DUF72 domain-containing protein [Myxococcales bacterium]
MKLFSGTSGYDYDAWRGAFYPEGLAKAKRLAFYAERFGAVEINYSFYRKPAPSTLEGWAGRVPPGFRFVLKGWQRITHQQRLVACGELVASFWEAASVLGERLGPILFQLPPNLCKDAPRLRDFLAILPAGLRAAFEFRHESWFDEESYDLLRGAGAALCVAESEQLATPLVRTAPFGYFRLRREDYAPADIDAWADRVTRAGFEGEVFVFFKHEDAAKGPQFAARFLERARLGTA